MKNKDHFGPIRISVLSIVSMFIFFGAAKLLEPYQDFLWEQHWSLVSGLLLGLALLCLSIENVIFRVFRVIFTRGHRNVFSTRNKKSTLKDTEENVPRSRFLRWLMRLPVGIQFIVILLMMFLAWHFRFSFTGVNESELMKIDGVLYQLTCVERRSSADVVMLETSLQVQPLKFNANQRCSRIPSHLLSISKPIDVMFYATAQKEKTGDLGQSSATPLSYSIYGIDSTSPRSKLLYPIGGLEKRKHFNFLIVIFLVVAVQLVINIIRNWRR